MRILLAEDEADLNQIITRKLTSDGYSVDSCYNGSEAIDFLEMADYDAVILDIMMPKMDGFGVLCHIRNTGKSAPVLFLTAKDSVADRVKGLDSGADDYLIKPFSLEELTARIRAMTRKKFNITANILQVGDLTKDRWKLSGQTHSYGKGIRIYDREKNMKNLSIRVNITAWFSGIMAFIVAVTFCIIFWVSNSVTQKSIQDNLILCLAGRLNRVYF